MASELPHPAAAGEPDRPPVPPPVVRIAGLPRTALRALRAPEYARAADHLLREEDRLRAAGRALADRLHPIIGVLDGTAAGRAVRPRLIGLRRAVFGLRPPATTEWSSEVRAVLPADIADRVDRWWDDLRRWRADRRRLPEVLDADLHQVQAQLRATVQEPGFRRALLLSSPSLSGQIEKWLADSSRTLDRPTLAGLARFVVRAAAKTSPFSAFTGCGFARWAVGSSAMTEASDLDWRPVLEPPEVAIGQLVRQLRDFPELAKVMPVRANPSLTRHDGRWLAIVGHEPAEPVAALPATDRFDRVLALVADTPPMWILRERLAAASGTTPTDPRLGTFLGRLVEAGLLELLPDLAEQSDDPVGELARWLRKHAPPELADLVDLVERLAGELQAPAPVADLAGIRRQHAAVRETLVDLNGWLAGTEPGQRSLPRGMPPLYDNCVFPRPAATCSLPHWQPALDDLGRLAGWLSLFHPGLALRLALAAFVRERFGPGAQVPFLAVHRATQEPPESPAATAVATLLAESHPIGSLLRNQPVDRVVALAELRDQACRPLRAGPGPDGVIRVDPAALAGMAAGWPVWVPPPTTLNWYVQPYGAGPEAQLVAGLVTGGHGRGTSRVAHLIARTGGTQPPDPGPPPSAAADGCLLAELDGLFGSSSNRKSQALPWVIDYPATRGARPPRQRIPLGDLFVVHDAERDLVTVRSRRLRREVRPLHTGLLANSLLPPAARMLIQAFGDPQGLNLGALVDWPASPDEVVHLPRVETGRVALRRARWLAPSRLIPPRTGPADDAAWLLRLRAWARAHGIPGRVFSRCLRRRSAGDTGVREWLSNKHWKPLLLDLDSPPLALGWERSTTGDAVMMLLEEALPDPVADIGPARAYEFLLQVPPPIRGGRRG